MIGLICAVYSQSLKRTDAAGRKTLGARSEHFFDEFAGALLVCKQNMPEIDT